MMTNHPRNHPPPSRTPTCFFHRPSLLPAESWSLTILFVSSLSVWCRIRPLIHLCRVRRRYRRLQGHHVCLSILFVLQRPTDVRFNHKTFKGNLATKPIGASLDSSWKTFPLTQVPRRSYLHLQPLIRLAVLEGHSHKCLGWSKASQAACQVEDCRGSCCLGSFITGRRTAKTGYRNTEGNVGYADVDSTRSSFLFASFRPS